MSNKTSSLSGAESGALDLNYWTHKNAHASGQLKRLDNSIVNHSELLELADSKKRLLTPIAVRVTDFGGGYVEASWGVSVPAKKHTPKGQGVDRQANQDRSARRACGNLRRKCMAMEADRILTLTFRENVEDWDQAWACFKAFTRRVNKTMADDFCYVAVPERQKRGAWHFHLAIKGWRDVRVLRELWRKSTPDHEGNIDITRPKTGGRWKREKLVKYLTKYLTKAHKETVLFNKKKFSSSRRIVVPTVYYVLQHLTIDEAIDVIADEVQELGGAVSGFWFGLDDYGRQGWCSSW